MPLFFHYSSFSFAKFHRRPGPSSPRVPSASNTRALQPLFKGFFWIASLTTAHFVCDLTLPSRIMNLLLS